MYINTFKYTPKDVSCQLCTEYVKKLGCTALRCPWLAERIEAGVVGYPLVEWGIIVLPAPSRSGESRTPNGSVNNTGTSADRGRKSPVPQGFFHAESQGAETFYPQARKQRLSAENCPCAGCVFFCAGALFFLKGDYHG